MQAMRPGQIRPPFTFPRPVALVWRRKSELGVEFQASDALINDRTEELYFDLMRRVPSLSAWEV